MKCYYHKADLDGKVSGALVKLRYPECKLYPVQYGDKAIVWEDISQDETVFVVDFSFPMEDMVRLSKVCARLVWIDHHVSASNDFLKCRHQFGSLTRVYDDKLAGCELTWSYLHEGEMPRFIKLLGRFDVWDHSPDVVAFQYGMRTQGFDPENVEDTRSYVSDEYGQSHTILHEGHIILDYIVQDFATYVKTHGFACKIKGMSAFACNRGMSNSMLFDSIVEDYDLFVMFCGKPGDWKIGITTRKEIDVSVIAKAFGGGGHKKAAGFKSNNLDFLELV